jgi:ATP/maltotriose-dependent transcriptional regulator MalT
MVEERFVGRVHETALLDHHFDQARDGRGQLVLVVGRSGIGKTALVRHALRRWDANTVWVSGDPSEVTLAGGLLDQLASQLGVPDAFEIGLSEPSPASPLGAGKILLDAVRASSIDRPLVVAVDDANWADDLSLKALTFAFRRVQSSPVLGIVVTRPDAAVHLPSGLTNAAVTNGDRIDLGLFSLDEVAQLAQAITESALSRRAVSRLYSHTDGFPLHVHELLHDLPVVALQSPGTALPAPRSVEVLVLSRLARSARETEQLVVAAAVLGDRCRLTDAATLAGLSDSLPALEEAEDLGLLVQFDATQGRACGFAHTLLRTAVYRDLGVARRAELHRMAATLTTGPAALEHRLLGCAGADPVLAADLEAQADDDLRRGRIAEAVRHLLATAKVDASGEQRDQRLMRAVTLLLELGEVGHAREYLAEIVAMAPGGERSLILGRMAMLSGDHEEAEQLLVQAWSVTDLLTDGSKDSAAEAACDLAQLLLGRQRVTDATHWADRAVDMAAGSLQRACAQVMSATCVALTGDLQKATATLQNLLDEADHGSAQLLLRAGLGTVLMWSDDLEGAAIQLGIASTASGSPHFPLFHRLMAQVMAVNVDYRRGRWSEASSGATELLGVIDDFDQEWLLARANAAAALPLAAQGNWVTANAYTEAAIASEDGASFVEVINARAALAFARDDPETVRSIVSPLHDALPIFEHFEPSLLGFWPLYAHALVRLGEVESAESVLVPFERLAQTRSRRSSLAIAARVRGCLEAARREADAAKSAFETSLLYLGGLAMPFEEALTRLEYGRHLRRMGQRRSAVRELSATRQTLVQLGAAPFLRVVDMELGAEPNQSPTRSGSPLTPRQRMVAQAVIAGKSNREIANELYVSIKTVEFHINQILTRLGVDSRVDIERALRSS